MIFELPTRIIAEPYNVLDPVSKRRTKMVPTDKGLFTSAEIRKMFGFSQTCIHYRLSESRWKSENVFSSAIGRGRTIDGGKTSDNCRDSGNEEWRKLSSKPRTHNLEKIK